jgi:serine/threonine protein kinase
MQDFQIIKVIGTGSYGKVCLGRHIESKKLYAIKALNKMKIIKKGQINHILSERSILQQIKHRFIVKLEYAF